MTVRYGAIASALASLRGASLVDDVAPTASSRRPPRKIIR